MRNGSSNGISPEARKNRMVSRLAITQGRMYRGSLELRPLKMFDVALVQWHLYVSQQDVHLCLCCLTLMTQPSTLWLHYVMTSSN